MEADWWARGIALASLIIGSAAFFWRVFEWWEGSRIEVRVEVFQGMVGWDGKSAVIIKAVNVAKRPVILARGYLRLPDGSSIIPPLEQWFHFPKQLAEGSSCTLWFDIVQLKRMLNEKGAKPTDIYGCFDDEVGRTYGRRFPRLSFLT